MVGIELSDPINVQFRLPVEVERRLREESERDMIPLGILVRKACLRYYGDGESLVPDSSTERTETARNIQQPSQESNDDDA